MAEHPEAQEAVHPKGSVAWLIIGLGTRWAWNALTLPWLRRRYPETMGSLLAWQTRSGFPVNIFGGGPEPEPQPQQDAEAGGGTGTPTPKTSRDHPDEYDLL